jgi:hypothetical protein
MGKLFLLIFSTYFCKKYCLMMQTVEIKKGLQIAEEKSAERVVLLATLAKIRQVSLPDLVKQINLKNYYA